MTIVFVAHLAFTFTDTDKVLIQTSMSSNGRKIIVAKERSDLHITCTTSANGVGVEWSVNDITQSPSGTDRIEMTERNATVNGQLSTLHTLIIRNTSTMDKAAYRCQSGLASDEADVYIVILASN